MDNIQKVGLWKIWLADYQASMWDTQIADDLDDGRLDEVLAQVDAEYEAGKAKPL